MCFAGSNHPVEILSSFAALLEDFSAGILGQGLFVFIFGSVSHGDDSRPCPEFPVGHAIGLIHFFGRNDAGTKRAGGAGQIDSGRVQEMSPFVRWPAVSSAPVSALGSENKRLPSSGTKPLFSSAEAKLSPEVCLLRISLRPPVLPATLSFCPRQKVRRGCRCKRMLS